MARKETVVILMVLWFNIYNVRAATVSDVETLYNTTMAGYNKYVRPIQDILSPVDVNCSFNLKSIKELDEVNGKLTVVGFFIINWNDSRIAWDPTLNNQISALDFPESEVWTPEITLANPYEQFSSIKQGYMPVQFLSNGYADWHPGGVMSVSCNIDMTYFPFDMQTCKLRLTCWGYSKDQILLDAPSSTVGLGYYTEHGSWNLLETSASQEHHGQHSYLDITIKFQRRSLFYTVNLILPMMSLLILNVFVFILPVESGERLSYAITVLLAIAVFLSIVGDNLPKTSQPMAFMCYFLLSDLVLSAMICSVTIFGLNIYFRDEQGRPVPNWVKKLYTKCCFLRCKKSSTSVQDLKKGADEVCDIPTDKKWCESEGDDLEITWKMIAGFLDNVMLFVCVVYLLILKTASFAITMSQ